MPIASIAFDFDPLLRLGDGVVVRWQTVALAVVLAACLMLAGFLARRWSLRPDDLLYIAVGAVPGAVIGGRLGQLILVPQAFNGGPPSLFDPSIGGLELGLGVVGGVLTGAYVGKLLGASVGRWADALALPVLIALGAGKLAMALGGSGQGWPLDAAWATAYVGPGPWGSLAPQLASHPSQLYEGFATLVLAVVLALAWMGREPRARDGRRLLIAVSAWAAIRTAVSVSWRDPAVIGPLPVGGLLASAIVLGVTIVFVATVVWWQPRARARALRAADEGPSWPDPETRTQF